MWDDNTFTVICSNRKCFLRNTTIKMYQSKQTKLKNLLESKMAIACLKILPANGHFWGTSESMGCLWFLQFYQKGVSPSSSGWFHLTPYLERSHRLHPVLNGGCEIRSKRWVPEISGGLNSPVGSVGSEYLPMILPRFNKTIQPVVIAGTLLINSRWPSWVVDLEFSSTH